MRISDLALAAGTTPRTVRHYHRLGLLPEPPRLSNGYRTYVLADLVRLMRIRWLASSGVPLGSIAVIADSAQSGRGPDDVADDLVSIIAEIDNKQATLGAQRIRLQAMLAAHRDGRVMSPLPAELLDTFDSLIATAESDALRELFERERESWELLALSGHAPPGLFEAANRLVANADDRSAIVDLYRRFAALEGREAATVDDEIELVAEELATRAGPMLTEFVSDVGAVEGATTGPNLAELVPDAAQRQVVRRAVIRLGIAPGDLR